MFDPTQSFSSQPEIMAGLVRFAMSPASYGAILTLAAFVGLVLGAMSRRVVSISAGPLGTLGALLLAGSILSDVPAILGLACFAAWCAAAAGVEAGTATTATLLSGSVRFRRRRRVIDDLGFGFFVTPTGRSRGARAGLYLLMLGAIAFIIADSGIANIFLLSGVLLLSPSLPFLRGMYWSGFRRAYRRRLLLVREPRATGAPV